MDRRTLLQAGLGTFIGSGIWSGSHFFQDGTASDDQRVLPTAYSIIPIVGDGKWVWTEPPTGKVGYLEPRQFELSIGIELEGRGPATQLRATTVVPSQVPEQRIDDVRIETEGCRAAIRKLTDEAHQLALAAPSIARRQIVKAVAHYRLTICKDYRGYQQDQFPVKQTFSKAFRKQYLIDSPGIQTRDKNVRSLARDVAGQLEHPWEKAHAFYKWVWKHIKARHQAYTNVIRAIRNRVGDCEERAATFVALCRASGIPARLVWVPNHNWAEFYLWDKEGQGHWIPAHTSAYSWFGWTGAHELVLQKGDKIYVPEKRRPFRLLADWMQWQGKRPLVRYQAELKPIAASKEQDAGPGARRKDEKGEWLNVGEYAKRKFVRR